MEALLFGLWLCLIVVLYISMHEWRKDGDRLKVQLKSGIMRVERIERDRKP